MKQSKTPKNWKVRNHFEQPLKDCYDQIIDYQNASNEKFEFSREIKIV